MPGTEKNIKIIECPRDAMQGWPHFIATRQKIEYINSLLQVGFDTIDFGSFVSPKAMPQMADTHEVIGKLDLANTRTKLLAIIANERGAAEAAQYDAITYLGFPFSISETFQLRNTNSTISESFERVKTIQEICDQHNKQLVIYISMGFGNPYGDPYNEHIAFDWISKMVRLDIKTISLADTIGLATPEQVYGMTKYVIQNFSQIETGVHLHSTPVNRILKINAASTAGCTRFDSALMGIGGCPMANDELVGNMDTEQMIHYFSVNKQLSVNKDALNKSIQLAKTIFV